MLAAFIIAALLLTPNPAGGSNHQPRLTKPANSHQAVRNRPGSPHQQAVEPIIIRAKCCAYALKYDTVPAYIMAVAHIESRLRNLEFRTWRTGDYYQPMGIQYEQYDKFARMGLYLDTLDGNIEVGARAFTGIHDLAALKRRLKIYNRGFDEAYWNQICEAIEKYSQGVSL